MTGWSKARSEAVFALACAMLQAGWPPQAVVATLARQPWIQRMRPNIIGWLTGDVARARAFLPGRGQRTDDARPRDHGDPASERMGTNGQALLGAPTPGASDEDGADQRAPRDPVPDDAEGPDRYAREGLVDRAPHCWQCQAPLSAATHATCRRCGWIICACGACAEPCRAAEPGGAPARHGRGVRLRTFDPPRAAAVREGLAAMREASRPSQGGGSGGLALTLQVGRMLGAFDRCRHDAWAHEHTLRERSTRSPDGTGYLWGPEPCDVRGHEDCAPFHAVRDLQPWRAALRDAYPTPVVALALTAPGWGLRKTRRAASDFLRRTPVQRALGYAAGFLLAEAVPQPGYAFHLLVPAERADALAGVLLTAWRRRRVPCGWLRRVDDLPPQASALEALGELRVRSEQALALAVADGHLAPVLGARWLAEETAAGTRRGGQPQRLVLGPGMRVLAQQRRQEGARSRPAWPLAAGAEGLVAAGPQTHAGQGVADSDDANAGRGSEEPVRLPAMEGADPGNGGGGPSRGPAATGSAAPPDDDDLGWVPCPWDPALEMKPTRRRRVLWWEIARQVQRGDLVPILEDGRVVGYRTPTKRRGRP